jgi:hypothetical protein
VTVIIDIYGTSTLNLLAGLSEAPLTPESFHIWLGQKQYLFPFLVTGISGVSKKEKGIVSAQPNVKTFRCA